MKRFLDQFHWLALAAVAWVATAVLAAELVGVPFLCGWPLHIVRSEGHRPAPTWAIIADALAGILVVAATTLVASWCNRTSSHGLQFRLSTLLGAVAVIAVLLNVRRLNVDSLDSLFFSAYEVNAEPDTSIMVDLTLEFRWLPRWLPHLPVRLGILLGLACMIYVVGWSLAKLVGRSVEIARRGRASS